MKTRLVNCKVLLPNRTVGEGDVVVDRDDGRIVSVCGASDGGLQGDVAETIDLDGCLVMPGLVNCHCHAPMTLLRGVGGGLPLQRWLEEAIFPVEAKMTAADIAAGMTWGALEMLAGGVTCVADMYDQPQACADALAATGMRGNVCKPGLAFPDGTPQGRLEECVEFARTALGGRVVADICVHSEYLTVEGFCRSLADANKELHRPLHVHVSETEREHDECIARHGKTPIAYLADTGLLDFGGYAAHCVWCTDDDFRIMAEKGVSLIHNPTSNMKLGSGFARIVRAMELGVNVALGTDGTASNDNLDMFEEMHLASLIHKGLARDPTVLSPWDVIEMATKNGAKALGRAQETGEIAAGMSADLCVVDLKRPHLEPAFDIPNLVVHSMQAGDVVMTMVDGEVLYDARSGEPSWPTINHDRALFDLLSAVRRLGLTAL